MQPSSIGIPQVQIEKYGTAKKPVYALKGTIALPVWNGYFLQAATQKENSDTVIQNGQIELWIEQLFDKEEDLKASQAQIFAWQQVQENQVQIKNAIINALLKSFPDLIQHEYDGYDKKTGDFPSLAALNDDFDFSHFIGPQAIRILDVSHEDEAYIQWYFNCRWDVEHGLEVVTHKDRVVTIGTDTDIWKIYKDNGSYEIKLAAFNENMQTITTSEEKPWWKFW